MSCAGDAVLCATRPLLSFAVARPVRVRHQSRHILGGGQVRWVPGGGRSRRLSCIGQLR